jgi:hypothetical protein
VIAIDLEFKNFFIQTPVFFVQRYAAFALGKDICRA